MNASDSDEKVRVPSIRLSDVKCLHTTSRDEDWCRSSIFHTYISHEGKSYKMIYKIDVPLLSLKLILIHNYMMLPELIKWFESINPILFSVYRDVQLSKPSLVRCFGHEHCTYLPW